MRPLACELECPIQVSERQRMREQREGIELSAQHRCYRTLDAAAAARERAFMGIDHVERAPVPLLHVHLAQSVLVVAGNYQASMLGCERTRQVESLLHADCFDDAFVPSAI